MRQWQVTAGLIYGQVKKSYRRRKLVRVTPVMRLGTEADLKGALQKLGLSGRLNTAFIERGNLTVWNARGSSRSTDLGRCSAVSTAVSPSGVVACVLSFCTPPMPRCWLGSSSREHDVATYRCNATGNGLRYGSRKNEPTMDCWGSPLFSPAAGPLLSLLRAPEKGLRQMAEAAQ